MPDGPVVANNTPLAALWAIGRLDLLHGLAGEVLVPAGLRDEFLPIEREPREAALGTAPWLEIASPTDPRLALAYTGLDQGEAEVLALAVERSARLVIIDELKGRRYARRLGLPLTGTVGVLLLAKEKELVDSVSALLDELGRAGLHLAPSLVAGAVELAGE